MDILHVLRLIQVITQAQLSTLPAGMAWSSVARCRSVFIGAEVSVRHFGTSANMSGQFGTVRKTLVPKCLGSEVSWVRSVLTPHFTHLCKHSHMQSVRPKRRRVQCRRSKTAVGLCGRNAARSACGSRMPGSVTWLAFWPFDIPTRSRSNGQPSDFYILMRKMTTRNIQNTSVSTV